MITFLRFIYHFRYIFPHVEIYNVSYMWFSAIPCMWTIFVGSLISYFYKPQDPKTLNPDLISPGLKGLFKYWPEPVRKIIDNWQIGANYVKDEKYHRIKSQQIFQQDAENQNQKVEKKDEDNLGFEMQEKM